MHALLSPLSLPQRLLSKALSPLAIAVLMLVLFSLWTIDSIVEARAAVALSLTTSNVSTGYSLDSSILRELADTYVQRQRNQVRNRVADYLTSQIYPSWRRAISSWNESLGTSVHAQRIMYSYVLNSNETITNTLYGKSRQINESLEALSATYLRDESLNLSELTVNYWFVSELFENVSKNDTKLANMKVDFPIVSNKTYFNISAAGVQDLVKGIEGVLARNFNTTLNTTAAVEQHIVLPRVKPRSLFLTAIFVSAYAVCVILLLLYEWIKYRWEIVIFNTHMDWHHASSKKAENSGIVTTQQRARQFTRQLTFTMHNAPVYWLSNWVGARKNKNSPHWRRLTHAQWWMWSNAGYFWLLLLAIIIHWQIDLSLVKTYSEDLEKQEIAWPLDSDEVHTINSTSVYPLVLQECDKFESKLFQTFNNSVAQLWSYNGTLSQTLDGINNQMNKLVHTVDVVAPPQWCNISLSEVAYPPLLNYSISNNLCANVLRYALLHKTTTKTSEQTSFISNLPRPTTQLHKWALVATVVAMATHHVLGLTVFTRL
ncbi:BN860_01992g1_1 [Zygosaccharomyces bailii CLIB 213]|uniref:BN860_01992g1_1 n=1 Tax=Zygosaccharomyces bailii (strain CLIB 213 / ATCC 58445 / CBS 680 / BCRC 21525 / NBRC 1098 / NCYC 1416 / NRRL Y-2227) TaxID=1333698 RepID=A0A8J2X6S6_ZYGB2|nr:BN860_01992g1_1 [Zygosaccharomyces bailii CLIB 213]